MTDKEILQKWCATYGENNEDIRATMWGEDLMIEFAKQYHKEQLDLSSVSQSAAVKSSGDFRDDDNRESQAEYFGQG